MYYKCVNAFGKVRVIQYVLYIVIAWGPSLLPNIVASAKLVVFSIKTFCLTCKGWKVSKGGMFGWSLWNTQHSHIAPEFKVNASYFLSSSFSNLIIFWFLVCHAELAVQVSLCRLELFVLSHPPSLGGDGYKSSLVRTILIVSELV